MAQRLSTSYENDPEAGLRNIGKDIHLNYSPDDGTGRASPLTVWLRYNYLDIEGDPTVSGRVLDYDGDSSGLYFGVDRRVGDSLRLGVALGYETSEVDADLDGDSVDDQLERTLPAIYPYLNWQIDDSSQLRLIYGFSKGDLEIKSSSAGNTVKSDIEWQMAALSLNRIFTTTSGVYTKLEGDLRYSTSDTDNGATVDATNQIQGGTSDTTEYSVKSEFGYSYRFGHSDSGKLRPYASLKLRHLFGELAYDAGGGLDLSNDNFGMRFDFKQQINNTDHERDSFNLHLSYSPREPNQRGFSSSFKSSYDTTLRQPLYIKTIGYRFNENLTVDLTTRMKENEVESNVLETRIHW